MNCLPFLCGLAMPSVLLSLWTNHDVLKCKSTRCKKICIFALVSQSFSQYVQLQLLFFYSSACWNHLKVLNIRTSHFIFSRVYSIYRYLFHSCLPLTRLLHLNWCLYRIRIRIRNGSFIFTWTFKHPNTNTIIAFRVCMCVWCCAYIYLGYNKYTTGGYPMQI